LKGSGKATESYAVTRFKRGVCRTGSHELIGEKPLLIRIDGRPYSASSFNWAEFFLSYHQHRDLNPMAHGIYGLSP